MPSLEPGDNRAAWLGRYGEEVAARFLRENGCKILYRNFRAPGGGEVDIVCRDRAAATLVFVEVKTRSTGQFGAPAEAVDASKQHLIARGALAWLRLLDHPAILFRFDIVEVMLVDDRPVPTRIQNAFQLPEPYVY